MIAGDQFCWFCKMGFISILSEGEPRKGSTPYPHKAEAEIGCILSTSVAELHNSVRMQWLWDESSLSCHLFLPCKVAVGSLHGKSGHCSRDKTQGQANDGVENPQLCGTKRS